MPAFVFLYPPGTFPCRIFSILRFPNVKQDIIAELADILEVLDGILSQYQIDFNTVLSQKEIKRKKSGGFDKG